MRGISTLLFRRYQQSDIVPVSAEQFHHIVSEKAYNLWKQKEAYRKDRNWRQAQDAIWNSRAYELLGSLDGMRLKAYEIYETNKQTDALKDWLDAERIILFSYCIKE